MIKQVSLSVLVAMVLTVIIVHVVSARAKAPVSVLGKKALVHAEFTESSEKDSLIGTSIIVSDKAIGAQTDGVYRGLWIWNTDIVTDTDAQNEFLIFAQLKNISGAYLYAYDLLPNNTNDLEDFISKIGDIGVEIELLAGDPTWALTPTHPIGLSFVQQAIIFTQIVSESAKPVGIHFDVEPYLLAQWDSDRSSTIIQYLDLLSDVKQELTDSSTGLPFVVDIPFWYDTITATYKSATKPLNQHVQDIADRVVIMDYRDFAVGSDGIIVHAQDEMDYAESITREVTIGVETNDVEPEKVTFFEEGETVLEGELALVEQHFQTSSPFRGFAIHDYLGYRALASIRSVYLSIMLKIYPDIPPICPSADAEGTVSPAVAIYSITFVVNDGEKVVNDANLLQAFSSGDRVRVKEVTICPVEPFEGSGGNVYVEFDPVNQNGQVIKPEVKGTQAISVPSGFVAIPGPNYTWTIGNWRHISVVTVHSPLFCCTNNPDCEGGACEVDDRMLVGIK